MRVRVRLDNDIYDIASSYARARGVTLGVAIGELIRGAGRPAPAESPIKVTHDGIPVFRSRGRALTSEMVRQGQEDELE